VEERPLEHRVDEELPNDEVEQEVLAALAAFGTRIIPFKTNPKIENKTIFFIYLSTSFLEFKVTSIEQFWNGSGSI
jgi:hypothetical protein